MVLQIYQAAGTPISPPMIVFGHKTYAVGDYTGKAYTHLDIDYNISGCRFGCAGIDNDISGTGYTAFYNPLSDISSLTPYPLNTLVENPNIYGCPGPNGYIFYGTTSGVIGARKGDKNGCWIMVPQASISSYQSSVYDGTYFVYCKPSNKETLAYKMIINGTGQITLEDGASSSGTLIPIESFNDDLSEEPGLQPLRDLIKIDFGGSVVQNV